MKILFTIAQIDFADHIALAYLSAIAKQLGCRTYLCVLDRQNMTDVVQRLKPDVVAYSANVIGFESTIKAHHEAKAKYDFISILGGPQATFSPGSFEKSGVDAYCIGEGEYVFRDFLLCVKEKKSYDNISNLITKKGRNDVRPLIRDLNDLPFPDRDLTLKNTFLKDTPKKTFYVTRGCPYNCSYCCNSAYHSIYKGKGPLLRRFSVERIIREIEYVKNNYKMDFIKFGDDCFALKADNWLEEFAEKYTTRVGIPFNCFLRIDTIDDALLKLLKNAGCHSIHLSVDSTSRHVRENILKRHMKDISIENTLLKIRKHGINTWVNYMLAAPGSTLKDDIDSIWMSKKGNVTYPSYSTTVPTSGTELYDYCIDNNLIDISNHKSDMTGCSRKSTLLCFDEKQKNIRYNIFLVGALISKLPFPLDHAAVMLIKIIHPNRFFVYLRQKLYKYYIENKIFRLRV